MQSETKTFGRILFPLQEIIDKPRSVGNFFSEESFAELKSACKESLLTTNYDHLIGRYGSGPAVPEKVQNEATQKIREITGNNHLVKGYNYLGKYQIHEGCIPNLWDHLDQNASQVSINVTIEKTIDWALTINDEIFSLEENSAVLYAGQFHRHARPFYPSVNESDYVIQLFMQFVTPDHWIISDPKGGMAKYCRDGDVRYFNERRYFPLPDPPSAKCENTKGLTAYARVLGYYEEIAEVASQQNNLTVETVDMSFEGPEEILPGVHSYSIKKESAQQLYGLIHNACFMGWEMAKYGDENLVPVETRPDNFWLYGKHEQCHHVDPITRLSKSLFSGIDAVVSHYSSAFNTKPVHSEKVITLLRTRVGQSMTSHTDAQPHLHRVITATCYFNDDYDGGEFVFVNFDHRIKPTAGQILIFPSNYLFEHRVEKVKAGVRYSMNRFYFYNMKQS
jgi:hypothetical protein